MVEGIHPYMTSDKSYRLEPWSLNMDILDRIVWVE